MGRHVPKQSGMRVILRSTLFGKNKPMISQMNRRQMLCGAVVGTLGLAVAAHGAVGQSYAPTRFSVLVRGRGRDVILIPGLTAGRDVWNDIVMTLPGYRYHLVQIAGFAGEPSRGNVRAPMIAGIVDQLSRYISAARLVAPAIIGHSMGGTIGLMLAVRHPAQVGRLMVVDMLPQPSGLFGSTPDRAASTANMLRNLTETPGGRGLAAGLMEFFGGGGQQSDPDVVSRAIQEMATVDLAPDLPRIRAPMTIVYATPDARQRAIVDRRYAAAYRAAPGARLVRVDNSGHMIMYDQPARLRTEVAAFMTR